MSSEISESTIYELIKNKYGGFLKKKNYDLLVAFEEWLASQGIRTSTRYRYAEVVGRFLGWLQINNYSIENLSIINVDKYISQIRRNLKIGTLHWYIVGVKKILRYLYYITDNEKFKKLYEKVKIPRIKQSLPDILSKDEVSKILESFNNIKYKALFSLVYETGCRISEALNLKLKDTQIDKYGVKVFFRKSKSEARAVRVVIFADIVKKWLEVHPSRDNSNAFLFFGRKPERKMARSTAFYQLKKAVRDAGIKRRVYAHLLRHTRATELYGFFKELEMMRWFGWRTRKMIDVYSKITQEDVETKYLKSFLKDKKNQ